MANLMGVWWRCTGADPRLDEEFATFRAFNRTLQWSCEPGQPAELKLTPDTSWPDIVYYHSFTHAGNFMFTYKLYLYIIYYTSYFPRL